MRKTLLLPPALLVAACGATLSPPPAASPVAGAAAAAAPEVPEASPAVAVDPFVPAAPFLEETLPALGSPVAVTALPLEPAPAGVPAAPASCSAFVQRKPEKRPTCDAMAAALVALDAALARSDVGKRDAALVSLEECGGIPSGVVRALRSDLAPAGCRDVINEKLLAVPPAGMRVDVQQTLFGQALGARLARLSDSAPRYAGPTDKKHVLEFIGGPVLAWMKTQATAVEALSGAGVKLAGYGRAIVAIEAGLADMRLVDAVRAIPVPKEIATDDELKTVYYAALDEALDPRKARGRDAALVGLRDFASVGSLHDARVDEARRLLSKLYGGRRIDALDGLALPALAPIESDSVELRLAAALPTFYAGILLDGAHATVTPALRALLSRGMPIAHRHALRDASPPADVARLAAFARIALGQTYWSAFDFDHAAQSLAAIPGGGLGDDGALLLALAIALRGGPTDAAAMMRDAPVLITGMGRVAALDALASAEPRGQYAGQAAFDAAVILQIAAPEGATAKYWSDLARRYEVAARLLGDKALAREAKERGDAAAAIAAAVK